jgi:zinc transport system substrate-binding protein
MNKLLFLATTALFSTSIWANVNTVVSILPQKTFVEKIGGDKVNVSLMVSPGNSPHTYEPKASQMKDISKADLYFAMDVEFEHTWIPKFQSQNKNMQVIDLAHGIKKIQMVAHKHHEEDGHDDHKKDMDHDHDKHDDHKEHAHHDHDEHHEEGFFAKVMEFFKGEDHHEDDEHKEHVHHDHEEGLDPHVWTSPANVKIIAKNIFNALVKQDPKNEKYYHTNYEKLVQEINTLDKKIKETLHHSHDAKFMIFHPAFGYFANQYHLEQIAIETEGKEPKPKELEHLIEEAKEEKIKAIFTSPEFSDKMAKIIAKELNIPVVKISPLNPKWEENLIFMAESIAGQH